METKKCNHCGETKPVDQFYTSVWTKDGIRPYCKKCGSQYILDLKKEVLSHYSINKDYPICARSGETDLKLLCLDHVNGGGREHLKSIGLYYPKTKEILGGATFYRWLRKHGYPNDPPLQVLCRDCNNKKQIENKEFRKSIKK